MNAATEALRAAVERLYVAFSRYRVGEQLTHCECCISPESLAALVRTPIRSVPAELLSEWTHSAHGRSADAEVKHFLPRYFELLLGGEAASHSVECSLRRLAQQVHWRDVWPAEEVAAVDDVLRALFVATLAPDAALARFDVDQILIVLASAGSDVPALIRDAVSRATKPQLARLASLADTFGRRGKLSNAFWSDHEEAERSVVAAMGEPATLFALVKATEDPADPELDAALTAAFDAFAP